MKVSKPNVVLRLEKSKLFLFPFSFKLHLDISVVNTSLATSAASLAALGIARRHARRIDTVRQERAQQRNKKKNPASRQNLEL